jgi:hypothetical protein
LLAGVKVADGKISVMADLLLCGARRRMVISGRCARQKKEDLNKREESGQSGLTGIFVGVRRQRQILSSNSGGLVAGREGKD